MFVRAAALHKKTQGRIGGKNISRAKAQRRKENLRKRGSALRLCAFAREIPSAKNTFCAKPCTAVLAIQIKPQPFSGPKGSSETNRVLLVMNSGGSH